MILPIFCFKDEKLLSVVMCVYYVDLSIHILTQPEVDLVEESRTVFGNLKVKEPDKGMRVSQAKSNGLQ